MSENILFHICTKSDWESAQKEGVYKAKSLESEGFIHCSTPLQLVDTANLLFKGQGNLLLLFIDQNKVNAEIKFENTLGGEQLFPHIYGALNLDAVDHFQAFEPNSDGYFEISM
ncbi:MAG: DUF952 domain-containing protein [Microscillaceae bacterium]|nr:DUF952 domain-containing protein [Microscillaceae bacterium]